MFSPFALFSALENPFSQTLHTYTQTLSLGSYVFIYGIIIVCFLGLPQVLCERGHKYKGWGGPSDKSNLNYFLIYFFMECFIDSDSVNIAGRKIFFIVLPD